MGLEELASFVEAVDEGSLAGAARVLGVPKSTISRRLARLEEELGQELVQRHSRLFQITESGSLLYHRSAAAVRELQGAARLVREGGTSVRGPLRLTLPQDLGNAPLFVGLFTRFREAWPEVDLTLEMTNRMVDLVAEGFDFAFRAHSDPLQDTQLVHARRLHSIDVGLFASPAYLDRRGRPQRPCDLAAHSCLSLSTAPGVERWVLTRGGDSVTVAVHPALRASSMAFLPAAARLHAGVVPIPVPLAGDLERVLPEWSLPRTSLSLLWPASRLPSPRRAAFRDFVVEHLTPGMW